MVDDEKVVALHRYFLQASTLKCHYEDQLAAHGAAASPDDPDWTEQWTYLILWYATLYVVVEGWQAVGLADAEVDSLVADGEKCALLKRFRNGAFHYQAKYFDERFTEFIELGATSAAWVRTLHDALGRALLERMASR